MCVGRTYHFEFLSSLFAVVECGDSVSYHCDRVALKKQHNTSFLMQSVVSGQWSCTKMNGKLVYMALQPVAVCRYGMDCLNTTVKLWQGCQ